MAQKTGTSPAKKLAIGLAAAAALGTGAITVNRLPYFVGEPVLYVIDGDSFKISQGQTIRLAGLNAPETGNCYSQEATAELTRLIAGKRVVLRQPQTDIYRRIMALVYVDGTFVNAHLIRYGYAVSTREGGVESTVIKTANTYARDHRLGIFSPECTQDLPPDPDCPIKGNINDRTDAKHYLTPDCLDYSKTIIERHWGEQWFCSEKAARAAGFTPSPSCSRVIPNTR